MNTISIKTFIELAGVAQIALALGSTAIPRLLDWKKALTNTQPIIKQMFWVYACYILVINLSFGLVSTFCAGQLAAHTTLATLVCGFIATYWISRLMIQFFVLDHSKFPRGPIYTLGEITLVTVFIFLSATYATAFYLHL